MHIDALALIYVNYLVRLMDINWIFCSRWFCHFDDDNYVNVKRLLEVLSDYSPQEEWYLGKPSIRTPLEILNREPKPHNKVSIFLLVK